MNPEMSLYALTNALQPVRRAWVQAVGRIFASTNVPTPLATAVLLVSRLGPAVKQKDLAVELGVNPAGMVRILDQGEAAGLLVRRSVAGDRRGKVVDLLPQGAQLARQSEEALVALRNELIGDIPSADVELATKVLRLLEERANQWMQAKSDA
jgi:MarR family transcriptional regulator, transcriptional regulator for hemolysin